MSRGGVALLCNTLHHIHNTLTFVPKHPILHHVLHHRAPCQEGGLAIRGLLTTHGVTDTTTYRLHPQPYSIFLKNKPNHFFSTNNHVKLCRRGILKRARSLPPEEFLLPQKLVEQLRRGEGKHGKTHDSGFNSEQNRFFIFSYNS